MTQPKRVPPITGGTASVGIGIVGALLPILPAARSSSWLRTASLEAPSARAGGSSAIALSATASGSTAGALHSSPPKAMTLVLL